MGKIRSTLDIVMEKTKGLSMSSQDKENLRHKELEDLARAWAQKYLGAKMTVHEMEGQLPSAGDEKQELLSLLKRELIGQIQISQDNSRVLDALESLWGIDREKVSGLVREFQAKLDGEMVSQLAALRSGLQKSGIAGSAVVPNIARSRAWQDTLVRAQQQMVDELSRAL